MNMLVKKNVFITGAAKRIGAEISKSLSTLDCNVVIHYNKSSVSAKKLCREINKTKKAAICVKADLCKKDELEKMLIKIQTNMIDQYQSEWCCTKIHP